MTQFAIAPVVPAQQPTVNQSSSTESSDFAPHLAKAVDQQNPAKSKESQQQDKISESPETTPRKIDSDNQQNESQDNQGSASEIQTPQEDTTEETSLVAAAQQQNKQSATFSISKSDENFFFSLTSKLLSAQTGTAETDEELNEFIRNSLANTSKGQVMSAVASAGNSQNEEKSTLLAQLQKIIENSSETGIVTIKQAPTQTQSGQLAAPAIPVQIVPENLQQQVAVNIAGTGSTSDELPAFNVDGMHRFAEKNGDQLTPLRQSTQEQYYDAKLALRAENGAANGDEAQQQTSGGETSPQLSTTQNFGQTSAASTDNSGVFSVPTTSTAAQTNTPTAADNLRPTITLPSGNTVTEDEVFQQITERFQISRRMADPRINIKLHPAELGELKIDLTVKEGAIRAHVVAQSQQVQQILEKNMSKLKLSLENQGFTIDEITVATQSDSVGDFDLFDGELAQQNEYTPTNSKSHKVNANFFQDEDLMDLPVQGDAGVNLTI